MSKDSHDTETPAPSSKPESQRIEIGSSYFEEDGSIFERTTRFVKGGEPEPAKLRLAWFTAKILSDLELDDGVEIRRSYSVEAKFGGTTKTFAVPANQFSQVSKWVAEQLGAGAILPAVHRVDAKVAAAIGRFSKPERRRAYAHTGWCKLNDGRWVYLTAAGALGAGGLEPDIDVELMAPLDRYVLGGNGDVTAGVRASLSLLDGVAPDHLVVPVLGTVFRAVLGPSRFVLSLVGRSGAGKSELAALAQQHWGPDMRADALPGSWHSTAVALEALASEAADALLVVDDYAPGPGDRNQSLVRTAEQLIRAVGNGAPRQRGQVDGTRRPTRFPRVTLISTGEDSPRGASILGRMLTIEVRPTDIEKPLLTVLQAAGRQGLFAAGLGGFVKWLAKDIDAHRAWLAKRVVELRDELAGSGGHARVPTTIAELEAGWELWCCFVNEIGVLTKDETTDLLDRAKSALRELTRRQRQIHEDVDPAERFLTLLGGVLASGTAHVAGFDGLAPKQAGGWGWRQDDFASFRPLGSCIGWVRDDGLYLEPTAAMAAVQRMARDNGEPLTISERTLHRRLAEGGHLASIDTTRSTVTVRRVIAARRVAVLHFPRDVLGEEVIGAQAGATPGQQAQPLTPKAIETPGQLGNQSSFDPCETPSCSDISLDGQLALSI
jgi:hypothetical protein